jgi:hypothetical protein
MNPRAQPNPPTVFEAALDYARCGIPVFPCNSIDKRPLTSNGFKNATRDETQILGWWQQYPNAMIGAPMGPASGIWAIDLDLDPAKKIDGKATLDQLTAQRGPLPPTWATVTPRGGRHLIFAWDPNVDIRNSASKIGPGIDVRGNGGYICLPPSRNATGGAYQWDPGGPQNAAVAPPWLIMLAKTRRISAYAKAALERECKNVAAALPSTRNNTLNTAAFNLGQLVGGNALDEQEVRDRLFEAAETCRLVADDGAPQAWATIDSGMTAGKKQPRGRPQPQSGTRPTIRLADGELLRILTEIEDALLASGAPVFSRAGRLVEPVAENMPASDGRKTTVARLRELSPESLLAPIAETAAFQKWDRKRKHLVDTDPPLHYVRILLATERRWRLPHVSGIITTPTLRPDGSLLVDPGYDPETELYLAPGFQIPPIPEHPTKDQALAALKLLIDLLSEFGFKGDMVRRGLVCNLETLDERPELRKFKRNTLRQAGANRATYVAASLTVMRAYLAAGAPEVCGPFGSYAEWSTMVRSPLVWLHEPDPVASVDATHTEDPELAELREWVVLWLAEFKPDEPYSSASFVGAASVAPAGFNSNPLKQFLLRVAGDKDGNISTKRLGEWLRRNSGRVVRIADGRRFWMIKGHDRITNAATFQLSEVR